jgi:hypothetical protein
MLLKRVFPSSWFKEEPTVHFVKVHSRGVDRDDMAKYAACSDFRFGEDIKPEKGHSFLHLISMGAGETYGPNSNADYFNKSARQNTCPNPVTPSSKTIQLDGGLDKFHDTFMKYGAVYREHNNSRKGGKPQGEVVAAAMNPQMHRGELIIKVANEDWSDDLEKVAKNEPIFFSMGTGVPYDYCSNCHNKAKTRQSYCNHLRYGKLQLDKEGNQNYAINDQPHLHDISRVRVPADKIAFGLRKVAADGSLGDDFQYHHPSLAYVPTSLIDKLGSKGESQKAAALEKLSEMEKRILMQGMEADEEAVADTFGEEIPECEIKKYASFPLEDVLGTFKEAGILLPPESFVRLVMKNASEDIQGLQGLRAAVRTVYSEAQKEGAWDELIEDSTYDPPTPRYWTQLREMANKTAASHSLREDIIQHRVLHTAIHSPNLDKSATARAVDPRISAESRYLAKEYAKYQISFVAGAHPLFATCVALQNQSC